MYGQHMEGVIGEEAGWIQGHDEGYPILAGPVKHLISSRTVQDSDLSFKGHELEFSDCQEVSEDSITRSLDTSKSTGGMSNVWTADKDEEALHPHASCAREGRICSGEDTMDLGGGLSSAEGGEEFRRSSAMEPSGRSLQYSAVLFFSILK